MVKHGGIDYATKKMQEYKNEALTILTEFPDNPIREGMKQLVEYTTDRKY